MSLDMSFDDGFSFSPSTPPEYSCDLAFAGIDYSTTHRRSSSHYSQTSAYSEISDHEAPTTQLTTPARSPVRHHGPLLLPKIRSQDSTIGASTKRLKGTTNDAWRAGHHRSFTNPELHFIPCLPTACPSLSSSTLCSPVSVVSNSDEQFRRASSCGLGPSVMNQYGYPYYGQLPTYVSVAPGTETFVPPAYFNLSTMPRQPSPMRNELNFASFDGVDESVTLMPAVDEPTTSLYSYLTGPNPAPSLVRQLHIYTKDVNAKHFWWDVRQIRPWNAFNIETVASIAGLKELLMVAVPCSSLAVPAVTKICHPETEAELHAICTDHYLHKLNAVLSVAQGTRHLVMRNEAGSGNGPSFISNYVDDTSALIYGRGLGRVVGLVKSYDRWNSGMRVEGNHKRVDYLRGLAHLHRCMREHGCRYGFIITEIELMVVRNGAENTPHFGYLEVQSIPLAQTAGDDASGRNSIGPDEEEEQPGMRMTALLALFYLHMLARDVPLQGQVGWKSEIGAPAEGTRKKCLPRDEWMPQPQLAEKREAKRSRGWVWPEEAINRKELGKRGVKYSNCK